MITLFVTIVVVIALLATMGYTIFSLQKSADIASITQRNVARMEAVVSLVRANARPVVAGGSVRLPAGDIAESFDGGPMRTLLPVALVGDDRTPWGARYGYCPAAIDDGAADQLGTLEVGLVEGGSDPYETGLKTVAGIDYVVTADSPAVTTIDGPAPTAEVLGFVVSPAPNQFDVPLCSEIIYRDGSFLIGADDGPPTVGGTVAAIALGVSSLDFAASDLDPTLFVAAGAVTGRTGTTVAEAMTLTEALEFWRSSVPRSLTIALSDDAFDVSAIDLTLLAPIGGRFIRIADASPGNGTRPSFVSASQSYLTFGVDGALDNVDLATTIGVRTLAGTRVSIDGSKIGQLRVDGGDVLVTSRSSVVHDGRPGSAIGVAGGHLSLAQSPGATLLTVESEETAMTITGGTVSLSTDLDAPDSALPWKVSGSGRLDIGMTLAGMAPQVSYGSETMAAVITESVAGGSGAATCTPLHPYVVHASCAADAGALRQSRHVAGDPEGWECQWASDMVGGLGAIPLPSTSSVDLVCSANPLN